MAPRPPKQKKRPAPMRTKIHRKILTFFVENQGSIDTPRGVSTWVNEGLGPVRAALEDLVKDGFLKAHRTSSTVAYSSALDDKGSKRLSARLKKR